MSTTVTYKGETLTTVSNDTVVLETEGTWVEDDFTLTDTTSGGTMQAKSNIDPTTSSQTIEPDEGYDGLSSVQINAMPTGTAGTPTATKGAVSNHSISVTPSVTNTTGYITGSTINGTAVTVSASELDSGSKSITANGNSQDVVGYASVDVAVPNSYSASDEGKVVSSGALVAQTSDTVTVNDTYDTTLINSLTVNVSGGGGISPDDFALRSGITSFAITLETGAIRDYLFYGSTSLQSFSAPNYTGTLPSNVLRNCTALTSVSAHKVSSLGGNAFQGCTALTALALPGLTAGVGTDTIRGCTSLVAVDLGSPLQIGANFFNGNTVMTTLVLRKSSVVGLGNINVFSSTPFASGGSGGTIYVPSSLIDSYKSAGNWSTINGYGTVTWTAIEGSYYETHYADGTPIPTT